MQKIVMITGATSGIGAACAIQFAQQGYSLVLIARREDRLKHLADELKTKHQVETFIIVTDVRDKQALEENLQNLPQAWKKVDVLINNAGLSRGLDPIHRGKFEDWDNMIDTNVKGLLYMTQIVSNWMIEHQKGHIINLGSIAGKEVYPNGNVYCATKHAVDALTKATRIDLLPYGIKVSSIDPGMVETEFSIVRFDGDEDRAKKVYEGLDPLVAQDIAETIWFVASRAPHVNINDLIIMPTAQATGTLVHRK